MQDLDLDSAFDDADDEYDNDSTDEGDAGAAETSTGYGAAAPVYRDQGWPSVLPLPRGKKFPPPTGYTGDGAEVPSYADVFAWCEDHPTGNLALVMPDGVIGIDVDDYDGKHGGTTLAAAEAAWGPLPPTVRSTSRDDTVSGIPLYRVPGGTRLKGQLAMDGRSDVEVVQRHHRYVVAYPSIHPTGGQYRWLDDIGNEVGIPAVEDLPILPDRWVKELTAASVPSTTGVTVDVAETLRSVPDGYMDSMVEARLDEAMRDLRAGGGSRHDATTRHVLALLRFAEQGRPGVRRALERLFLAFVDAVTGDGRTLTSAQGEFRRMLTNPRGHALIAATPTIDFDELAGLAEAQVAAAPPAPPTPPAGAAAPGIPDDGFWDSRESLSHIRDSAYARRAAPWGVLGSACARAISTVPHTVTLPPLIGGPASLNAFVAMVGPSGAGKGAAEAVARELVPHDAGIGAVEVGSGEGLAHQYVRRASASERKNGPDCDENGMIWLRRSVAFSVTEVDTLGALDKRTGSTLMGRMRSAWSGEPLGFAYATAEKALVVGHHDYRLTMTVGVQPQRAAALLDGTAGGTPQRFLWAGVTDPRIRRLPGRPAAIVPLLLPDDWPDGPWTMPVPDIAADTVIDAHVARQRGEGDALDGHSLLCRLKVMAALCVLDGRIEPNEEDWALSGLVMAQSDRVRQSVVDELAEAQRAEAAERGGLTGVERDAAEGAAYAAKLDRVCGVILRGVERLEAAGKPATEGMIGRLIAGRDRSMKADALEALILHRELVRDPATGAFSLPAGGGGAAG